MTKKFIILFILILVLNNCGYSPIYSTKYQDFKLSNIIFSGERDINKILKRRLDNYTQNESAEKIYNVTMNSSLQKNIDTKDKKGNPTQFSLRINVDLVIVDKSGKTVEINFSEKKSYNNKDEKFELQMYENNLIQNMTEKIVSDMILFFQNPY